MLPDLPPHYYWDGNHFPSHFTSFGVIDTSNTTTFEEYSDDINTFPPYQQDNESWENWAETNPEFESPPENDNHTSNQNIDHYEEEINEESNDLSQDLDDNNNNYNKTQSTKRSSSLNWLRVDMILLLQRFSYYYVSMHGKGETMQTSTAVDRFAGLEEDDVFVIKLPSHSIFASKSVLGSESTFFKLMIESQMKEAKENEVDFGASSNEEELDILRILKFLRFGSVGVPIKGTAFPKNLDDFGKELIGIVDLLRLLDMADKFGVISFIESATLILNQYNVMIILDKALQISPELGNVLVDACINVISNNLPCVLGGLIYEDVFDEFLRQLPSRSDEWNSRCKEVFKIYYCSQKIDSTTNTKLFSLKCLKTYPVMSYLVDVLPYEILLQVLKRTERLSVDDLLGIVTLWIMSSSFETCFQDYSVLDNLEKDNIIYRLKEGLNFVFDNVETWKMSKENPFLLLHPILRYYNRSYPSEFKLLLCKFSMSTTNNMYLANDQIVRFSSQIILPMFKKFIEPFSNQSTPLMDQQLDLIELFSEFFLNDYSGAQEPFSIENANRLIPLIFSLIQTHNPDILEKISHAVSMSLFYQFENIRLENMVCPTSRKGKTNQTKNVKSLEVCMIGLDESGKTLLLEKIKSPNSEKLTITIPTIGFNSETISYQGAPINVIDIGGSIRIRGLWSNFISSKSINLLIMVVDLSNRGRFQEARNVFDTLMDQVNPTNQLEGNSKPFSVLLLGNKTDCIPDSTLRAVHESELYTLFQTSPHVLHLNSSENTCRFKFLNCSAKTGEGIEEMLSWFFEQELMGQYTADEQCYFGFIPSTTDWLA